MIFGHEILVFKELLANIADSNGSWSEVFQMEDLTTNLTFDVILRATCE